MNQLHELTLKIDRNWVRIIYSKLLLLLILKNRHSFLPILNTSVTIIKSQIIILSKVGLNNRVRLGKTWCIWPFSIGFAALLSHISIHSHIQFFGDIIIVKIPCSHGIVPIYYIFTINKPYIDNFSILILFITHNNLIL